jgi:6-phosphogluconate dehydrogenase (decarboxylating)
VSAALAKDPQLKDFSGFVQDSGEGRWTIVSQVNGRRPILCDARAERGSTQDGSPT